MGIREEFADYEIDGFLCQQKGSLGGNALLASSEKMIIFKKLGILSDQDISQYITLVRSCQVERGLYRRLPYSTALEAQDDYLGIMTASYLCGFPFAEEVFLYGDQHGASWNNQNPGHWTLASYFGRSPAFEAHLYLCAKRSCPIFLQAAWSINMLTSGRSDPLDEDSRTFCWMMLQTEPEWKDNPLFTHAATNWRQRFKKDFPGGMRQVQAQYLGDPDHPLARYWPEEL